jgi:hypothetical protein
MKEEEEELSSLLSSLKTKSQIRNPHFINPRSYHVRVRQLQGKSKAGKTTTIVCRLLFF